MRGKDGAQPHHERLQPLSLGATEDAAPGTVTPVVTVDQLPLPYHC